MRVDIVPNTTPEDGHLAIFSRYPYRNVLTRPGDTLTMVGWIDFVEEAISAEHRADLVNEAGNRPFEMPATAIYRGERVRSRSGSDLVHVRITAPDTIVHTVVGRAAGCDVINQGEYTVDVAK